MTLEADCLPATEVEQGYHMQPNPKAERLV
jgi:hypothetical protein